MAQEEPLGQSIRTGCFSGEISTYQVELGSIFRSTTVNSP